MTSPRNFPCMCFTLSLAVGHHQWQFHFSSKHISHCKTPMGQFTQCHFQLKMENIWRCFANLFSQQCHFKMKIWKRKVTSCACILWVKCIAIANYWRGMNNSHFCGCFWMGIALIALLSVRETHNIYFFFKETRFFYFSIFFLF